MGILAGKVAIVSGSGGGIGRAEAQQLARLGAHVVVNDLSPENAEQVAAEIRDDGGEASVAAGDVSDWATAESTVAAAVDGLGRLDILVNNAGNSRPAMIFNMTEDDWDSVIRVHLKGSFALSHFAAIHWRALSKAGKPAEATIVNTSSVNGLNGGNPGYVNYTVAKSGLATMTTTLARELASYGVRVNAVAPLAYSEMTAPLFGTEAFPDERPPALEPENVAAVTAWLASSSSGELTGEVLEVRGTTVLRWQSWAPAQTIETDTSWTFESFSEHGPALFS